MKRMSTLVALLLLSFGSAAVAAQDDTFLPEDPKNPLVRQMAGAWTVDAELQKMLGYPEEAKAGEGPFPSMYFTFDSKVVVKTFEDLDNKTKDELKEDIEEELEMVDLEGARLTAAGFFTPEKQEKVDHTNAALFFLAELDGNTYFLMVVPNLGYIKFQVSFIQGESKETDRLVMVMYQPTFGEDKKPKRGLMVLRRK